METTTEQAEATGGGGEAARQRRRRIAERGSDRMALITGRIQTLSPPPPNSPNPSSNSKHSHTQSSPALLIQDRSFPQPPLDSSDQIHIVHKSDDDASGSSAKHDISNKLSRGNAFNFRGKGEPQLRKCETNIGVTQVLDEEAKNEAQPLLVTPKAPKPSVDKELYSSASNSQIHFFNPKEINFCIVGSEMIRVFCAVIIALLVVLSNINHPRNIVKSRSTIASRPLYILLLTDVTIVVVRLLEKRRGFEKTQEEEKLGMQGYGQNWVGAVKILEIGLVFYQIVRALFIDCSFYMVVVICGLSLV